jgi:hypothetical protein
MVAPYDINEVAMLSLERNLRGSAVADRERVRAKDSHAISGSPDGESGS